MISAQNKVKEADYVNAIPFAIQYIERPVTNGGHNYGGYVVNSGTSTVFVDTGTSTNTRPLYTWLGNGNDIMGRDMTQTPMCFSMPSIVLNPSQYNTLVASMDSNRGVVFKGC